MATIKYSSLLTLGFPQTIAEADILNFDIETLSANDITTLTDNGTSTTLVIDGNTITITGLLITEIDKAKFVFADGSKLLVGDTTAADTVVNNTIVSTDFDDYISGGDTAGIDTASYSAATSAVTVSLATGTSTGGAGEDKLVNIDNLIGSIYNDTLTGDGNGNQLDGGLGVDTLTGGDGDDTYIVTAGDTVVEGSGGSAGSEDLVKSTIDWTLSTNVEKLKLDGTAIVGVGNASVNTITGNASTNILDGKAGADTLVGGDGNDTYIVDNSGDITTEADLTTSGAADWVHSSAASYSLMINVENLRLTGTAAINGTGNSSVNTMIGNNNNNQLDGADNNDIITDLLGGNDTLIGGDGADTLTAGKGNDILKANGGSEETASTVFSGSALTGATIILAGLTLTTTATMTAAEIVAAFISQDAAGKGDFTGSLTEWSLQLGGTVSTLVATSTVLGNVTNFAESGTHAGLTVAAPTIVTGTAGVDDLDIDSLTGGTGNDTYYVTGTNDVVNEAANPTTGGTTWINANNQDEIKTSVTYSLNDTNSVGVDNLTIVGSGTINATGNSINNVIKGNSGRNTLNGGKGNDTIDGATVSGGNDTLIGGDGTDTINGGSGDDVLIGNTAIADIIGDGDVDTMDGGLGNDTYYVTDTSDVVHDNGAATSLAVTTLASAALDTVNTIVTYTIDDSKVENLTLIGTAVINGFGNASANILTGNGGNNVLVGSTGADTLNGGTGNDTLIGGTATGIVAALTGDSVADTMNGGAGNDIYYITDASDTAVEDRLSGQNAASNGLDLVNSTVDITISANIEDLTLLGATAVSGTGNAVANIITGNNAASGNTLIGLGGNDTLNGGTNNDRLVGGEDSSTITTASAVDTLKGGDGEDTYVIDSVTDIVQETNTLTDGSQDDTVFLNIISGTAVSSYTLTANVENLVLGGHTGTVGTVLTTTTKLNGTGNASNNNIAGNSGANTLSGLGGVDTLKGGAGNDILDGGTGADIMDGGADDDTYIVDTTNTISTDGDQVSDTGVGTDTVQASATYTIFDTDVEILTLTGTAAINGTGNNSANTLNGNSAVNILTGLNGNDIIDGKAGADNMIGGAGDDTYYVDNISDVVNETGLLGNGTDLVIASVSYSISDRDVENLTLATGTSSINGTGNASANVLTGNSGANALSGSGGGDTLIGGLGKDSLSGGDNDTSVATGGDTFVFASVTESSASAFDIITDFGVGNDVLDTNALVNVFDKIDLSAIDANTSVSAVGDQAFTLNASLGVVTTVPVVVSVANSLDYYINGGNTYLIGDTDGVSTTIEFKVQLTGFIDPLVGGSTIIL